MNLSIYHPEDENQISSKATYMSSVGGRQETDAGGPLSWRFSGDFGNC